MNEFEGPVPIIRDDKAGIELQDVMHQEFKLIGHFTLRKGMTLYEIVMETGEIRPLQIDRKVTLNIISGKPVYKSKAIYNPKCFYIAAINKKNAIRKYNKIVLDSIEIVRKRHEAE